MGTPMCYGVTTRDNVCCAKQWRELGVLGANPWGGGQEEKRVRGGRSQRRGSHVGGNGQGIGGMAKRMISESQCEVACVAAIKHLSSPQFSTLSKICCSCTFVLVWMRDGLSGGQNNGPQTCPNPRDLWWCSMPLQIKRRILRWGDEPELFGWASLRVEEGGRGGEGTCCRRKAQRVVTLLLWKWSKGTGLKIWEKSGKTVPCSLLEGKLPLAVLTF